MLDLVTDFKKIIDKSTNETIKALEDIYKNINIEKNKMFIRNISKYYMGMVIWNKKLKEGLNDGRIVKLLDNILLDYCSILNCVILGDEKVMNFLYRNIIESVLRIISLEFDSKEIDCLFNGISKGYNTDKEKEILDAYSSLLKSIYNHNCLYIHTDVNRIPERLTNLIEYRNNSEDIDFSELIKKFDDLNIAILCIFQIKYYFIYNTFKPNAKGLMAEIIPYSNRIKFGDFEKEMRLTRK